MFILHKIYFAYQRLLTTFKTRYFLIFHSFDIPTEAINL